jgi:hypothetical protein
VSASLRTINVEFNETDCGEVFDFNQDEAGITKKLCIF